MNGADELVKVHCNKCLSVTKHRNLFCHEQTYSDPPSEEYPTTATTLYELLECAGCEEVCVRRRYYFSEWNPGEVDVSFYPPRIARQLPRWIDGLSPNVAALLKETYQALQAGGFRLAMMGARAIVDIVMVDKIGDVGSFKTKLLELQKAGFLSEKNAEVLEAALDVGSAAAHRGYRPTTEHVRTVMDIVENLLHATILQDLAAGLKNATPARINPQTGA